MTDQELIAMARLAQHNDRMSTGALYGDLADRIEELKKQCSAYARADQLFVEDINELEAKLAKTVETLREFAKQKRTTEMDMDEYDQADIDGAYCQFIFKAHAVLALIGEVK